MKNILNSVSKFNSVIEHITYNRDAHLLFYCNQDITTGDLNELIGKPDLAKKQLENYYNNIFEGGEEWVLNI